MTLTEAELEQRRNAARKHGVYAVREKGEAALDEQGRSYLAELREHVQDREGVLGLLQERAATAVLLADLLTSYVIEEHKAGVPLEEIKSFNVLPAFQNSAQRALKSLYEAMPKGAPDGSEMAKIKAVVDASKDGDR
jgi:hypothetical protein